MYPCRHLLIYFRNYKSGNIFCFPLKLPPFFCPQVKRFEAEVAPLSHLVVLNAGRADDFDEGVNVGSISVRVPEASRELVRSFAHAGMCTVVTVGDGTPRSQLSLRAAAGEILTRCLSAAEALTPAASDAPNGRRAWSPTGDDRAAMDASPVQLQRRRPPRRPTAEVEGGGAPGTRRHAAAPTELSRALDAAAASPDASSALADAGPSGPPLLAAVEDEAAGPALPPDAAVSVEGDVSASRPPHAASA